MSRQTISFLILLLVALLARAVFAGYIVGWQRAPIGDEVDYHKIAASVADGDGVTVDGQAVARRPPLYPLVLALLYKVTGPSTVAARILQVLLGTLIVFLTWLVAKRYADERAAWIAASLVALNPFLIFISGYILTENLYIVLLLAILLIVHPLDALLVSWRRVVITGVVLGLACMARPTAFFFACWIAASVILFMKGRIRYRVTGAAVMLATVFLVITPWAARNYAVFGKWMWFTSHGGITFYQGNNAKVLEIPQYRGNVAPLYMLPGVDELNAMDAVARDEAAWRFGKQFLRDNPDKLPVLYWNKFTRYWRLHSDAGMSGIKSGWWFPKDSVLGKLATRLDVGFAYAIVVFPLFLVGIIVTLRRWRWWLLPYGLIVAHTGIALVFHGSLRMRIPTEPIIALLAVPGLLAVWQRLRRLRSSAQSP